MEGVGFLRNKPKALGFFCIKLGLLVLVLAHGGIGCTDVDVDAILPYQNDKLSVEGDFCSTDPANIVFSTRVLFLVDCSDGMRFNDPEAKRADAIRDVIADYREEQAVLFSIIRFGEQVVIETETFTKDENELQAALDTMKDEANPKQFLGGSDYIRVLSEALRYLIKDQVTNPQERDSAYIIVFLSDGELQASSFDPMVTVMEVLQLVRSIHAMGVVLHTLLLSTQLVGVPEEFVQLVPAMAAEGGGEHRQLGGSSTIRSILGELLDLTGILRIFELREFFVYNHNAVVAENNGLVGMYVDSDGDGLADFQEDLLGTSPVKADTDEDGIADLVELTIGSDPLAKEMHGLDLKSEAFFDDDRDGLNNYEETLLGTYKTSFDSDGDGIPDGLEVWTRSNPLAKDDRGDYDNDFFPNLDEIRAHTNIRYDEAGSQMDLGYRYRIESTGRNRGRFCYHFRVDNITLRSPKRGATWETGRNLIRLYLIDRPLDNPEYPGNMITSTLEIVYKEPNYRNPNAFTLFLEPEGFK